eukprot:gene18814-20710_t
MAAHELLKLIKRSDFIVRTVMKPRLNILSLCLAVTFISYTITVPLEEHFRRGKRDIPCAANDDRCIEDSYWDKFTPMGFFVSSNTGDTGSIEKSLAGNKRSGPLSTGSGSGSGSHVMTRSKIPGPKVQAAPQAAQAVAAPVSNMIAETPLTQTVSSSSSVNEGTKKSVFCQGEKEWLQCPMYKVLKVKKAFWGRGDTKTCSDKAVTRTLRTDIKCEQDEANTMKKVETMCNDEEACELVASETFFDRADCPSIYKYVEVEYECLHREMRVKETTSS